MRFVKQPDFSSQTMISIMSGLSAIIAERVIGVGFLYRDKGSCRFGDNCKFSHDGGSGGGGGGGS